LFFGRLILSKACGKFPRRTFEIKSGALFFEVVKSTTKTRRHKENFLDKSGWCEIGSDLWKK